MKTYENATDSYLLEEKYNKVYIDGDHTLQLLGLKIANDIRRYLAISSKYL